MGRKMATFLHLIFRTFKTLNFIATKLNWFTVATLTSVTKYIKHRFELYCLLFFFLRENFILIEIQNFIKFNKKIMYLVFIK